MYAAQIGIHKKVHRQLRDVQQRLLSALKTLRA
jgi:hypothetical protein